MKLYPLKLKPIYKEKIWGGKNLEKLLKKKIPESRIGESWEVADHIEDSSIVLNGELEGMSLHQLLDKFKEELVGKSSYSRYPDRFPLLYKFIDASDKLSVQVHPDNEYARMNEDGELGKTEMWVIVHAEDDSYLIAGLKHGTTKEVFKKLLEEERLEECLHKIPVKTGDVVYIPSGRVHAILPGLLINEIQQNSDTTYRVYDWGRVGFDGKPRPIHIKQSIDVINFNDWEPGLVKPIIEEDDENRVEELVRCEYFISKRYILKKAYRIFKGDVSFAVISILKGEGDIYYGSDRMPYRIGESILIPAMVSEFSIKPAIDSIVIYSTAG